MKNSVNGTIIINNMHTTSPKFVDTCNAFTAACESNGVNLSVKTNFDFTNLLNNGINTDFVLFWDKDVRLARRLEKLGVRVFNNAQAIEDCNDKSTTYLKLLGNGIEMLETLVAPFVYYKPDWSTTPFIEEAEKVLTYPLIVKECFGSFGKQVFLVNDRYELLKVVDTFEKRPFLLQKFVSTSEGRDLRLQVVGKEVVATMYRYNDNDFRANVTNGGLMKNYTPNSEQCEMALKACEILGLDFGGVDLLFGEDDRPVLCEVNSNAHFINLSSCTGVNVADKIIKYVIGEINK